LSRKSLLHKAKAGGLAAPGFAAAVFGRPFFLAAHAMLS
jgi:hypothetical protein